MEALHDTLSAMEAACESEDALVSYHSPDVATVIASIHALPVEQRHELHGRLDHIRNVMEMNLAIYEVEKERLRKQVAAAQANSAAAGACERVAVIQVNRT